MKNCSSGNNLSRLLPVGCARCSAVARLCILLWLTIFPLSVVAPALAALGFSPQVAGQTIIQRGAPWVVTGTADENEKVAIEFLGSKISVRPSAGNWSASVDVPEEYAGQAELIIGEGRLVKKVQVGDIWLCSGQSNMALPVGKAADGGAIAKSAATRQIYLYQAPKPITRVQPDAGKWLSALPAATNKFSALCLAFGTSLHEQTKVPIGLVDASLGGTAIESWISSKSFGEVSSADDSRLQFERRSKQRKAREGDENIHGTDKPSQLFDLMIGPLSNQPIRGVLWYQGEGNRVNAESYGELLTTLIRDWRSNWQNPRLPFVIVQLPGFGRPSAGLDVNSEWAAVRDAQRIVAADTPQTGLVVTVGLGDGTIHPGEKLLFGQKAAAVAHALTYAPHQSATIIPTKFSFAGETAVVEFGHGRICVESSRNLRGSVYLAGKDRRWHAAEAVVSSSVLVARSPEVPHPIAIRYAWADNPPVGLQSCREKLPVTPFRSDDWPLIAQN